MVKEYWKTIYFRKYVFSVPFIFPLFQDLFSSTTTFVTVDGRGIGNSKPFKPVFTEYKPDLANTKYQPVSALVDISKFKNNSKLQLFLFSHTESQSTVDQYWKGEVEVVLLYHNLMSVQVQYLVEDFQNTNL